MSYKIAVVGATGNVGREILEILAQREFPAGEVVALASRSSLGKQVSFGDDKILEGKALDDYDFKGTDIALFSPGSAVSKIHAPRAAAAGCVVIDNTSYFRMDSNVPLVVPEVNSHALKDFRKSNIIANPNCSTIQMVVALSPLHAVNPIKRVVVSTYQSVSGAGKEAMDELYEQTKGLFVERKVVLSCSFRCDRIHNWHSFDSSHTLFCCLSPTLVLNKPVSVFQQIEIVLSSSRRN
jgi:aspartate-semialdehyde dehydrogenase